jgi:GAF domain-containing protein
MSRERHIVETFVELADAMVGHLDAIDFLHRLCARAVELLDCDEAGVLLLDGDRRLRVMGSSSERAESIELLQSQIEEGPCPDCIARAASVSSQNLAEERDRWPSFARAAVASGFLSVRAVPMSVRGELIGALNLFRARAGQIAEDDRDLAKGMADIAAVALLQDRDLRHSESVSEQLQGALDSRVVIEQAKGILAERDHVDVETAFRRLREHARQHNLRLSEVARRIIDGDLGPGTEDVLPV